MKNTERNDKSKKKRRRYKKKLKDKEVEGGGEYKERTIYMNSIILPCPIIFIYITNGKTLFPKIKKSNSQHNNATIQVQLIKVL